MTNCSYCDNQSEVQCSDCGKKLCQKHIKKGISLRTNNPVINCPDCLRNQTVAAKIISVVMSIVFILIIVYLVIYLNSILAFF